MALSLDNMKSSKSTDAPIMVVYGVDGIGKTTFASEFAQADGDMLYLPTKGERTPGGIDLPTPGTIEDFNDLYTVISDLRKTRHGYKWLLIDSIDGLEPIIWRETCARMNWATIEAPGFGKGYLAADDEWSEFMGWLDDLKRDGMGVIMIAHSKIVRFDSPITEPYNRYTLKLQERANGMIREKVDIVAFMNYRVNIVEKEVARNKSLSHAEGGKTREVCFNTSASYDAKNRYDMPDAVTYKKTKALADVGKYFPAPLGVA